MFRGIVFIIASWFSADAFATKYVQWTEGSEVPVAVYLQIAEDKKIKFPEPVALGVTPAFKQFYRYQNLGTVIYLMPKSPLKTPSAIRLMAKGQKTNNTYILVVRGSNNEMDSEPVDILVGSASGRKEIDGYTHQSSLLRTKQAVTPVALVRYASQQLYAPSHAIEHLNGVKTSPLDASENLDFLYPGNGLSVSPIAAFTAGNYTVTALKVRNKSSHLPVTIQLEKFATRINGVSVSSQHKSLGVSLENSETAVYVVTVGDLRTNLRVRSGG